MEHPELPDSLPIHKLSHDLMSQLCNILDAHDTWEELTGRMPEISMIDVDGCRRYKNEGSPSWYLLRVWGSKGYTIADLYILFALSKLLRCMRIIRDQVPAKYHYIEHELNRDILPSKSSNNFPNESMCPSVPFGMESLEAKSPSPSNPGDDSLLQALQNTLTVSYNELASATSNFSNENILGKGGYGVVYKGEWKQMNVAVKRINATIDRGFRYEKERIRQSLQELRTLAKYRHDNILPLYAFCLEGDEPCLVYKFMDNGSLEDRLLCRRGTAPLTWQQRWNIAEGTARGLLYLHTTDKNPIIHGDVKSANILLDKYFEPKLGDFGLSRDGQVEIASDEKSPLIASHIKGTLAYLPPEFITSKILSTKLDVYSYGIVLLEMATGLRAYVEHKTPHILLDYVFDIQANIRKSRGNTREELKRSLMDKRQFCQSSQNNDTLCFHELLKLGMLCSQKERTVRPNFEEVTALLSELLPRFQS